MLGVVGKGSPSSPGKKKKKMLDHRGASLLYRTGVNTFSGASGGGSSSYEGGLTRGGNELRHYISCFWFGKMRLE